MVDLTNLLEKEQGYVREVVQYLESQGLKVEIKINHEGEKPNEGKVELVASGLPAAMVQAWCGLNRHYNEDKKGNFPEKAKDGWHYVVREKLDFQSSSPSVLVWERGLDIIVGELTMGLYFRTDDLGLDEEQEAEAYFEAAKMLFEMSTNGLKDLGNRIDKINPQMREDGREYEREDKRERKRRLD